MGKELAVVVLAAGKGTRMRSDLPKVLHKLAGWPLINHVIHTAEGLGPKKLICVVGPDMPELEEAVKPHTSVVQTERLGTGHALKQALSELSDFKGTVLVLYGDTPLVQIDALEELLSRHAATDNPAVTVLGFLPPDPTGYGRLVVKGDDILQEIVEHKDASPEQLEINLCNSGIYAIDGEFLPDWISKIDNKNAQGEYYITDLPLIASRENGRVTAIVEADDYEDMMGVNSRAQLAEVEMIFQTRMRAMFLELGVTMLDPATVYFSADTEIAADVVLEPNVFFGTETTVEEGCIIKSFSHIEGAYIAKDSKIGPFARIRPGTNLSPNVEIGNFVEVNRSTIGPGTKAKHLTYLGDTITETGVNIGAGTITCNYDGVSKNKTLIKENAFIGSNSTLIAPLTVNDGAYIAAGSTVSDDVEQDSLYVARSKGASRSGWASRHRAKKKK